MGSRRIGARSTQGARRIWVRSAEWPKMQMSSKRIKGQNTNGLKTPASCLDNGCRHLGVFRLQLDMSLEFALVLHEACGIRWTDTQSGGHIDPN